MSKLTKQIDNTIYTVFFDKNGHKPKGLIVTRLDKYGQTSSVDKISLKDCKSLSRLIFSMSG